MTDTLAEGRVTRTVIFNTTNSIVIYNVHNFNLTPEQLDDIKKQIHEDLRLTNVDPTANVTIVAGDWNFCVDGEGGFAMNKAETEFHHAPVHSGPQAASRWKKR